MFKLRLVFEPLGVSIVVPRNQKQNKNKQECVLYSYRGCTRARIYSISSLPPPKKKKIFVAALSGLAFDCFSFRVSLRSRCLHVFYLKGNSASPTMFRFHARHEEVTSQLQHV